MHIRKYNKAKDENQLMKMIGDEKGWDYANDRMAEKYKLALEKSVTYVAYYDSKLCGFSRSIDDCGLYIYVCDLLVEPAFRGQNTGRKLMECISRDYPDQIVYVMSDVDRYYKKLGYERAGSVFTVPNNFERESI
jgi:GNAT superfamily N-acetyltransferase